MQFNRIGTHHSRISTILDNVSRFMCALFLAIGMIGAQSAPPTLPPAHKSPTANPYFSGTVTDVKADSITVVRKLPAKDPVARTFAMDAKTTVEGRIRENARVTVRYAMQEDGSLRAVHVIVRP
jgi:hypothetical protein